MENFDFIRLLDRLGQETSPAGASRLLQLCFEAKKNGNPGYSLGVLCREAGIPSKGHVSNVLRGARALSAATAEALGRALGLRGLQLKYLRCLVELEGEKEEKPRTRIATRFASIRKALHAEPATIRKEQKLTLFAMELYCAFGCSKDAQAAKVSCPILARRGIPSFQMPSRVWSRWDSSARKKTGNMP